MLASVVIPTKDRLVETRRAVASAVLIPTVNEVIIVDDGSSFDITEYTVDTLGSPRCSVRVLRNSRIGGAQHARVVGASNSTNDIIIFLDSDDILRDNVDDLVNLICYDHALVFVYANVGYNGRRSNWLQLNGYAYRSVLANLCLCCFSGVVVRKSKFPWDRLTLSLPAWQDDDFCIEGSKVGCIGFVDTVVAEMGVSGERISASKRRQYIGLKALVSKNANNLRETCGRTSVLLWKVRILALRVGASGQELSARRATGVTRRLLSAWTGAGLTLISKTLTVVLRPFFDRIYA